MKQSFSKEEIGFTQVKNEVILFEMSLGAKGLYLYLRSKPDEWDFAFNRIATETKTTKFMILKLLKELEDSGCLKRTRLPTGRVSYFLYAKPTAVLNQLRESPVASDDTVSNKESNTNKEDISNTNNIKPVAKATAKKEVVLKNDSKDVNSLLLYFFSKLVPAETTGRRFSAANRTAMDAMLSTYGISDVRATIDKAKDLLGKPYKPQVQSPLTLLAKYEQVKADKIIKHQPTKQL